jgi:gluconolactonase
LIVSVLLDNYFGRQFNSLNDVAVNPRNKELYFTDVSYGYLQDFRPLPGLRNQVYRFNVDTGAVTVVADGFNLPNGKSPSVTHSSTDRGQESPFLLTGATRMSPTRVSIKRSLAITTRILPPCERAVRSVRNGTDRGSYRYDVQEDGTWGNHKVFAFVNIGIADGQSDGSSVISR